MRALRARVGIDVSPADVFRVLTDFDSYVAWNPWLKDVSGEARVGERVVVRPNMASLLGYRLTYVLEKIQTPDTLRWCEIAWFSFLFHTVREYQVFTRAGGASIYAVSLGFHGPLAPLVRIFYGPAVRRGLRNEAEALKNYCETHFPVSVKSAADSPFVMPEH